jgi:hypothetical protein
LKRFQPESLLFAVTTFVGLTFAGIGAWRLADVGCLFFGDTGADAQVVDLLTVSLPEPEAREADGSRRKGYVPVLQWTTEDGHVHRMTAGPPSDPPRFAQGDTIRVVYDPERPYDAQIHTPGRDLIGPAMTTVAGILLVLLSTLRMRRARRRPGRGG